MRVVQEIGNGSSESVGRGPVRVVQEVGKGSSESGPGGR